LTNANANARHTDPQGHRARQSQAELAPAGQHLAFVRQLPCVACGRAAPSDAAHVRKGANGGVGVKPADRYAVPLCNACHALQHGVGELSFWAALRIDPSTCH
jgi:hypothetical protein